MVVMILEKSSALGEGELLYWLIGAGRGIFIGHVSTHVHDTKWQSKWA